jgi:hypothetical protein
VPEANAILAALACFKKRRVALAPQRRFERSTSQSPLLCRGILDFTDDILKLCNRSSIHIDFAVAHATLAKTRRPFDGNVSANVPFCTRWNDTLVTGQPELLVSSVREGTGNFITTTENIRTIPSNGETVG